MTIIDLIYFQNPWLRDSGYRPREQKLPQRALYHTFLGHITGTKQITSLTGIRRVGKSTLMKQAIAKLLDMGTTPEQILYFSFDQPTVTHEIDALESVILTFFQHIVNKPIETLEKTQYIFLDEIQLIPFWQDIVKRFYDVNQNLKFVLSGSSSLFLLTKSKESLAGRIFSFQLPPLTFNEYELLSRKHDIHEFLDYGQFPELLTLPDPEKKQEYLKEIVSKVLEIDIVNIYGIRKMQEFERLFWSLLPNAGQIISSQQLMADIGIKKATLFHYLKILESSLLINKAVNTGGSFRSESRLLRKLYPGSSNFLTLSIDPIAIGFKVETYVSSLIHNYNKLSFYHKRNKEIDFILPDKKLAIEVKYTDTIRPEDYRTLSEYSEKKGYTGILVTKSVNTKATKTIPTCISLDQLETFMKNHLSP